MSDQKIGEDTSASRNGKTVKRSFPEGPFRLRTLNRFLIGRLVWVFSIAVVFEFTVPILSAHLGVSDEVAIQVAHAIEIAITIAGTPLMASIVAAFIGSSFRESK